jgi:hypothetical protein
MRRSTPITRSARALPSPPASPLRISARATPVSVPETVWARALSCSMSRRARRSAMDWGGLGHTRSPACRIRWVQPSRSRESNKSKSFRETWGAKTWAGLRSKRREWSKSIQWLAEFLQCRRLQGRAIIRNGPAFRVARQDLSSSRLSWLLVNRRWTEGRRLSLVKRCDQVVDKGSR